MSVSAKVLERIHRIKKGVPFSIAGFYALGPHTSVQKAMSRLAKEGVVVRVSKGYYVRPKPLPSLPSITVTASAEKVARKWAKEHRYKLLAQGQEAAYRLGMQTQAPVKAVFWSNGPSRQFRIGNEVVEVRHASKQKLRWPNQPEGMLLRGLVVTPPEALDMAALNGAVKRLSLSAQEARVVVQKLKTVPVLHAWQGKLQQFEQTLAS